MKYIQDLLQEGSTQRGIIWCLGAFGVYHFDPEQIQAVVGLTMALAGSHGLVIPDSLFKRK